MRPKQLITIALVAFVAVSLIVLIARESGNKSTGSEAAKSDEVSVVEDRLIVYYFHGNARCVTCRTIESYTKEAVEMAFADELRNGSMEFQVINVETPSTVHFIRDYQLYAPLVVVVRLNNNTQADWKNLDRVWRLVGDRSAFLAYVQNETAAMLQRNR
jgi:hypothetical protein